MDIIFPNKIISFHITHMFKVLSFKDVLLHKSDLTSIMIEPELSAK